MPITACACSSLQLPPKDSTSRYSAAIQDGSVSTSVPSISHSTARTRLTASGVGEAGLTGRRSAASDGQALHQATGLSTPTRPAGYAGRQSVLSWSDDGIRELA